MKRIGFIIIIALATLCFFMAACSEEKPAAEKAKIESLATTPEDIKKEAKDLAETTMSYTKEQKALYQQKIKEKMVLYGQKLDEMQDKVAIMNEQAKAELTVEMENLSNKKVEITNKLLELQTASGEAYEDLKEGMDRAMDEMDKAYYQATRRFDK
jgi:hypothetical protein